MIISIVPRLPPSVDGVGDYALSLACQIRLDFGIETHFLVCDPTWLGSGQVEGFHVSKISRRSAKILFSHLAQIYRESSVLLHYVGYGYADRGCPLWLIDGLKAWREQYLQANLVTMFHEIAASGPVWTSAFWLSALQRSLVKQLLNISNHFVTSKQLYAETLQDILGSIREHHKAEKLTTVLPVFSSVGELENILPLADRPRTLVVFGGLNRRLRVYQHCQMGLIQICEKLSIEKIIDIGPTKGLSICSVEHVPVDVLGIRSSSEISQILSSSFAGFLDYSINYLGKSSIFASYCAHGMLPIIGRDQGLEDDGLRKQFHYWFLPSAPHDIDISTAQKIATNAHIWYQSHNLSTQAKAYCHLLTE
ncbi:glycosyltransferase family 1 protein [Phormidium sp. FACHB-322]|nr:glycosyltransferase family 1 protein [Phormidium sp. FACHB-77]MBD2032611.1 glycosyltransferase family 1 protein [Phormidium sp. FACHB-322]MBD2049983.1 glycosyltransferase family 1 protein [Leptolyngbya sp. FACHB-60]